jgi:hypothetical protein
MSSRLLVPDLLRVAMSLYWFLPKKNRRVQSEGLEKKSGGEFGMTESEICFASVINVDAKLPLS